jgi:hypothetical protein
MNETNSPKVYVTLGFHASFYHSWRGDSPDEAGFGTDIRVVRKILSLLNQANADGLQARGYWDFDVFFTVEKILPEHAPDILQGIRQRVNSGLDEIVLGPYNNGANHAATSEELRIALSYAIENPYGSGLKQVFGKTSSIYRSQEAMYTTGQNAFFQEAGITGLILYYSGVPFNTLSTFIPALSPAQRYNPLWMRSQPGENPLVLFPCVGISDILEHTCLEAWLWELHEQQARGEIRSDVLVHINADADLDAWLPVEAPRALSWFPNLGGLEEFIQVVNRYPWAAFTVPSEYLAAHPPMAEILVRQDLADGGFDGSYPWAEKYTSLVNWTQLEGARLAEHRARTLAQRLPAGKKKSLEERLSSGQRSPFFNRMIGLSTTHFGMSTPVINEERQAKASDILGKALGGSLAVQREAAAELQKAYSGDNRGLYTFEVYDVDRGESAASPEQTLVRMPIALPPGVQEVTLLRDDGLTVPSSWVDPGELQDGWRCGEIWFLTALDPSGRQVFHVMQKSPDLNEGDCHFQSDSHLTSFCADQNTLPAFERVSPAPVKSLDNRWLHVDFNEESGISTFRFEGVEIGRGDFLSPFITYGKAGQRRSFHPQRYALTTLEGEGWNGMQRVRLQTQIDIHVDNKKYTTELSYTFTLFDELPCLFLDVLVNYALTPARDVIHNYVQKLRRPLDLNWVETAPCQLQPSIYGRKGRPLRIWKHNYLGITSHFDLDYGQINPKNSDWDSLNHQVTAGWLGVGDGEAGLLLAERAEVLASMAFCPMRLRESGGGQRLALNPFGSYFGRLPDYSHLGGNGVGAAFTKALSGALKPNGPSFNGRQLRFSLLLAPYSGDEPPKWLQSAAMMFFYPPGVFFHRSPLPLDARLPEDFHTWMRREVSEKLTRSGTPPAAPVEFLANPADGCAHLVWRQPGDLPVSGYEARWRAKNDPAWKTTSIPPGDRWVVPKLVNEQSYLFQLRAYIADRSSPWTETQTCTPGAVSEVSLAMNLFSVPLSALLRMVTNSLRFVLKKQLRLRR